MTNSSTEVDEFGRLVVRLPDEPAISRGPVFVALLWEAEFGRPRPARLLYSSRCDRMVYLSEGCLVQALCADRAQEVVDGSRTVDGRLIAPEAYLKLWRRAVAQALPVHRLGLLHNFQLLVHMRGTLELLREARSYWDTSPFTCFREVLQRYPQAERQSGRFELSLDLATDGAARAAWHINTMGSQAVGCEMQAWTSELELRPIASVRQADLFDVELVETDDVLPH